MHTHLSSGLTSRLLLCYAKRWSALYVGPSAARAVICRLGSKWKMNLPMKNRKSSPPRKHNGTSLYLAGLQEDILHSPIHQTWLCDFLYCVCEDLFPPQGSCRGVASACTFPFGQIPILRKMLRSEQKGWRLSRWAEGRLWLSGH